MKNDLKETAEHIAAARLELAARNLRALLDAREQQTSLESVVASIERTMIDSRGNNPLDLCDMMAVQASVLDAMFHHYIQEKPNALRTRDEHMGFALKAQAQLVRTLHAWKKLKTETYIKHQIVKYVPDLDALDKKHAEQTEQDYP